MTSTTSSIPVEIYADNGNPIPDRYSSEEQALRAEVERLKGILDIIEGAVLDHDWQRIESTIEAWHKRGKS